MSTVAQLLTSKPQHLWHISPDQSVYEAIELMDDKGIGALAVVQNDQLIGILSERDYARKIVLKGRTSRDTTIKEIMTRQVLYVTPDQSIEGCMVLMSNKHVRHLPVINDGKLVGMISQGDVVKEIISEQQDKIKELENYISWEENY